MIGCEVARLLAAHLFWAGRHRGCGPVLETPEFPVAWQHGTGYAVPMRCRTHSSLALRMGQIARMLMLVLGVLSVPSVGPAAMQRPHCAQHDPSAIDPKAHTGDTHRVPEPTNSTSWEGGTDHNCPHCPATECARVAPCTSSSNSAILEASLTVCDLTTDHVRVRRVPVHPYSSTQQPPTPPPQLIS